MQHDTVPNPGTKYARWTVVGEEARRGHERMVRVRCSCGMEKVAFWQNVKSGKSESCGCLTKEKTVLRSRVTNSLAPIIATELAWAAGFFDGEGHARVTMKHRDTRTLMIQIGQIERTTLDRFRRAVGVGSVTGPYRHDHVSPNHAASYQYACSNFEGVQHVIALLWQFLSEPKKAQMYDAVLTARG